MVLIFEIKAVYRRLSSKIVKHKALAKISDYGLFVGLLLLG